MGFFFYVESGTNSRRSTTRVSRKSKFQKLTGAVSCGKMTYFFKSLMLLLITIDSYCDSIICVISLLKHTLITVTV